MLGYDVRNGKLYINEEGAEIVRLIFHKFVNENKGTHIIARELREAGIRTSTYMKQWSNTVILRNEKYAGDLTQKKTITPSYLNHEQKSKHSNRYCFSGKIKCEVCGNSFVSRTKKRKDDSVYKAWRCYSGATHGSKHTDKNGDEVGCNCSSVNDDDFKNILQKITKSLLLDYVDYYNVHCIKIKLEGLSSVIIR